MDTQISSCIFEQKKKKNCNTPNLTLAFPYVPLAYILLASSATVVELSSLSLSCGACQGIPGVLSRVDHIIHWAALLFPQHSRVKAFGILKNVFYLPASSLQYFPKICREIPLSVRNAR
jgi:hypothetical protein